MSDRDVGPLQQFVDDPPANPDPGTVEEVLAGLEAADERGRKRGVQALRNVARETPSVLAPVAADLAALLGDDQRSVRLATAKLFAALADHAPEAALPAVPTLAGRLADEDELYYVRARSAEALGYVALEHPEEVASPEVLADLRIGLSFDEPEVKRKLAKALEQVALGDPSRLRHRVSTLADHLDDGDELVRYHLTTALVVVGCEHPDRLAGATGALRARLDDGCAHVRGRAAEALGLLARAGTPDATPLPAGLSALTDDSEPFAAERARFARRAVEGSGSVNGEGFPGVGSVEGVRTTTADALAAITAPDDDGECPHCGLALPGDAPPMCPRCGGPC